MTCEHVSHVAVVRWFGYAAPGLGSNPMLLCHAPNEGARTPRQGAYLKKMGMRAGLSDLMLFQKRGPYGALFIEMKRPKGRLTAAQADMQTALTLAGYRAIVCYSSEAACKEIEHYLRLPKP